MTLLSKMLTTTTVSASQANRLFRVLLSSLNMVEVQQVPLSSLSGAVATRLFSEVWFWFEGTRDALIAVFIQEGQRIGGDRDGAMQRTAL